MSDDLHAATKKIKQSLRLSMNGVISAHQRAQGLDYKINFGVEIPRLKSIAAEYSRNKELSLALWAENIRECKLLAIFLMPEEYYAETADKWIEETPYSEIADHLSMNILCRQPDALHHAVERTGREEGFHRYCGYLTIARLVREGEEMSPEEEQTFYSNTNILFENESNTPLCRCAFSAICNYIDGSHERTARLLARTLAPSLATAIKEHIE